MFSIVSSVVAVVLANTGEGSELSLRPWAQSVTATREFETRAKGVDSVESSLELVEWCESKGLYRQMAGLLTGVLKENADHEEARAVLGYGTQSEDGSWLFEESERYTKKRAWNHPTLPRIVENQRTKLLKRRSRAMKVANKTSYFDINTDLESEGVNLYGALLNDYYRKLKTRFRAYKPQKIMVHLFANRSDYLEFFWRNLGRSGEHVNGFYVPGALVFYDDPHDRADSINTARHECTHLLIDLSYDGAPMPKWIHEGLACYFAADAEHSLGEYTASLFMTVMDTIEGNAPMSLDELMRGDPDKFDFSGYAAAWSWVHFLNQGVYQKRFQRYLIDMRDKLKKEDDPDRDACQQLAADMFESHFQEVLLDLPKRWNEYFSRDYRLTSVAQALDFADHCLDSRVYAKDGDPSRAVDMAQAVLDALPSLEDPDEVLRRDDTQIRCRLRRLRFNTQTTEEYRLGLRAVLDSLDALPQGHTYRRGHLLAETMQSFRWVVDAEDDGPCDVRQALVAKAEGDDLYKSLVVLFDEVATKTYEALAATLREDNAHRGAAHDWILASMWVDPDGAEPLFDTLRFLVEIDPDDQNLAALALAYAAMGDVEWGRDLMKEAEARSVSEASLTRYLRRMAGL